MFLTTEGSEAGENVSTGHGGVSETSVMDTASPVASEARRRNVKRSGTSGVNVGEATDVDDNAAVDFVGRRTTDHAQLTAPAGAEPRVRETCSGPVALSIVAVAASRGLPTTTRCRSVMYRTPELVAAMLCGM